MLNVVCMYIYLFQESLNYPPAAVAEMTGFCLSLKWPGPAWPGVC